MKGRPPQELRGHHLICLHFFRGEGYRRDFIEHLSEVLDAIEHADLKVVSGPDSVCRHCPNLKDNICRYSEGAEEEIRNMDKRALNLLNLQAGSRAQWTGIRASLPVIFSQWFTTYCQDCDWIGACEKNEFFQKLRQEQGKRGRSEDLM